MFIVNEDFAFLPQIRSAKSFVMLGFIWRTHGLHTEEKRMLSRESDELLSENLLHFPPFPQSAAAQNPLRKCFKNKYTFFPFPASLTHSLARLLTLLV
jgi:hypothetical protein